MTNERFFRMLSVALLGLVALAAIPPKSQATDAAEAATDAALQALPIEITIVREIDDINAGRFNPYVNNDVEMPLDSSTPKPLRTLTQLDPNL